MPPESLPAPDADARTPADVRAAARQPDFARRAPLDEFPEWMDEPCSREEMRACLRDLAKVNRLLFGYRPILHWLEELRRQGILAQRGTIRILDVGCGYGDTLRRIEQWARAHAVPVELTGIDLNADTIAIAAEATSSPRIRFTAADVFAYAPRHAPHLVVSSLFTHHLPDAEIVRFLGWMERHAQLGWCINDLSRHRTPYRLFAWFARLLRLHPFVRHDGPVSIARAFREDDWRAYCAQVRLGSADVEMRGFTPGRLRVCRARLP